MADGFNSASGHTYVQDQTQKGGVWKGLNAIVIRADSSGTVSKVNSDGTVHGPNGSSGGAQGDIFTTANGAQGWLGTTNVVVNPK